VYSILTSLNRKLLTTLRELQQVPGLMFGLNSKTS